MRSTPTAYRSRVGHEAPSNEANEARDAPDDASSAPSAPEDASSAPSAPSALDAPVPRASSSASARLAAEKLASLGSNPPGDAASSVSSLAVSSDASTDASAVREALDRGLASLRRARAAARDAGNDPARMLDADENLAAAVQDLERAEAIADAAAKGEAREGEERQRRESLEERQLSRESSISALSATAAASGNLANALLARGRLRRRLFAAATAEAARANAAGLRAGTDGAAAFHAEAAEEFLVRAGRGRHVRHPHAAEPRPRAEGAARALVGWGAALALRGRLARETGGGDGAGAVEAAALAAAASEKYRVALEPDSALQIGVGIALPPLEGAGIARLGLGRLRTPGAAARAGAYLDWGDALRLAAEASAEAARASARGGSARSSAAKRFAPPRRESWARAGGTLPSRWRPGGARKPQGRGREGSGGVRGGARKRVGVREGERLTDRNARTVLFRDKVYVAVSQWRASSEYQQNEIERPGRNREHDGTTTVQASAGNARARSRDPHTRRRADALFRSSAMAAEEPELEIELAPDAEAIAAYGDGLAQMAGATHGARTIHVHPVGAYSFGVKQARPEKDATVAEAMLRHKAKYEKEGLRRHVEAILLVNQHNHPHVLLLQSGGGGAPATFRLPGGRLRHGEGEVEGLQRKLHNKLSPAEASLRMTASRGGADPGSNPTTTRTSPRTSPDPRRPARFSCASSRRRRSSRCPKTRNCSPCPSSNCTATKRATAPSSLPYPTSFRGTTSTSRRKPSDAETEPARVAYEVAPADGEIDRRMNTSQAS